ncbi:MAG: beta-galactosidase [Candidatus Brocadiia bacterium]
MRGVTWRRAAGGRWAAALVALLAAGGWAEEAPTMLRTDRPGNLFPHGEKVAVAVDREAGTVQWTLRDLDGRAVASGKANGGTLDLGALPRGYYELAGEAEGRSARLALGVITDHSAHEPPSGPLNVDGATAWLERQGRHGELAEMLRMAGIGWVRERFSWAGTEPREGEVDWQQYDAVAEAFARRGVRVYQIFHDTPPWTHPGEGKGRNPDDLRCVYRFARRVAEHYKGRVRAWEVWNEPDIPNFWPHLSDAFAGVQKAAYLGFKAGDPDLPVLLASFCRGRCAFDEALFESGIADYFDIFNWHVYAPPARYPHILGGYLDLLEAHGCAERPVWLTEAGIRLRAAEPGGELSPADERRQADFVPRSFAGSLAAGTDRHFFFVLPYYLERGVQFGSLRRDLSPRPAFVAIATAVDLLGEGRYLGAFAGLEGAVALAFDAGSRAVAVVWSDSPRRVALATGAEQVEVADVVGRRERRAAPGGRLELDAGPSPQYVAGLGRAALAGLEGKPRARGELPTTQPCPVVVRGRAGVDTVDKGSDCTLIGNQPFPYAVEVCNLDEERPARGEVRLELPPGWEAEPREAAASLEPMGREVLRFTIRPLRPALGVHKVWVRPGFEGAAPAVSYFRFDLARVAPAESIDLGLDEPGPWRANVSGNGTMGIEAIPGGGVHFDIRFTRPGDRWCYPRVDFPRAQDFSRYDAVAFEYRCDADDDATVVRLQVVEAGGAAYITHEGWKARKAWSRAVCSFESLAWGSYSAKDPNGALDTDAVRTLMIGANTPRDSLWMEVRGARLVRFGRQ